MVSIENTEYPIGTLVFTVHNDEFRSAKIKRIVLDSTLEIDGVNIERSKKQISRTKEQLFNNLVERFSARQKK